MSRKSATAFALVVGFLPYMAGGCLVFLTTDVSLLVIAGLIVTLISTAGAYFVRSQVDQQTAKQRLIVDPILYGVEYAFSAFVIYLMFLRGRS